MNKWVEIIFEAEDMWRNSAEALSLQRRSSTTEEYMRERDFYKARRILDMYGYDYFRMFVDLWWSTAKDILSCFAVSPHPSCHRLNTSTSHLPRQGKAK